jgi:SecD/SecF fusion protein
MPEQKTNRLWLWIVIGVGLLMTMLASLSVLAFVTLPMILQATGSKPGGAVLTYEVDPDSLPPGTTVNMESLMAAVDRRLNPDRRWSKLARVRRLDDRRIEVAMIRPDPPETERVKGLLARIGTIEFRILADKRQNKDLIDQAQRDPSKMTILDSAGNPRAWWVPVKKSEERSFGENVALRTRKDPGGESAEILVLNDIYNVNGGYLTDATAEIDQRGCCAVGFSFNSTGGQLFGRLTSTHLPDEQRDFYYLLGIILDGELYSAPRIMTTITDRGQITGNFAQAEVEDLVNVLNSGSFPARIRLVGEKTPP